MRGFLAIYRRELGGLFLGPLAWTLLVIAYALQGLLFLVYLKTSQGDVDLALRFAFGESWAFWALAALFPPLLTMRMISEESRMGLLEYLLTAPVTDVAVVLGKFCAATTFMALVWSAGLLHALLVMRAGVTPDWGAVWGGWLGAVLVSGLFCATGLCASSFTNTPVVAAFGSIVAHLLIVILPLLAALTESESIRSAIARVDVVDHHKASFLVGVVDSAYAGFFLVWTALFLFVATRSLEARRWR